MLYRKITSYIEDYLKSPFPIKRIVAEKPTETLSE